MRTSKTVFTIVALIAVAVWLHAGVTATRRQDQTIATLPVIDFPPMPSSLQAFADSVDLVILGTVGKKADTIRELQREGKDYLRQYQEVDVVEILRTKKKDFQPPYVIVRRTGGLVPVQGRGSSVKYLDQLPAPGRQVVLFLVEVPGATNAFDIAHGPDGSIAIDALEGNGEIPPGMAHMREIAKQPRVPLTALLQALRGSK
jgi:hypothetical protein